MRNHFRLAAALSAMLAAHPPRARAELADAATMQARVNALLPGSTVVRSGQTYTARLPMPAIQADDPAEYNGAIVRAHAQSSILIIDSVALPRAFTLVLAPPPDPGMPDWARHRAAEPQHIAVGGLTVSGAVDGSGTTGSHLAFVVKRIEIASPAPDKSLTTWEALKGTLTLSTIQNGRLDIAQTITGGRYTLARAPAGTRPLSAECEAGGVTIRLTGQRAAQLGPELAAFLAMVRFGARQGADSPDPGDAEMQSLIRKLIAGFQGAASGMEYGNTCQGTTVIFPDTGRRLALGDAALTLECCPGVMNRL